MPVAGAVQVTWVGVFCLQADGGSMPPASLLLFARMTAFISAPATGLCDAVPDCAPEPPLRPIQVLRPATTRTTAANTAIQRACGLTGLARTRNAVFPAVGGAGPAGLARTGPARGGLAVTRLIHAGLAAPGLTRTRRAGHRRWRRVGIYAGCGRLLPAGHVAPGERLRRRPRLAAGWGAGLRHGGRGAVGEGGLRARPEDAQGQPGGLDE